MKFRSDLLLPLLLAAFALGGCNPVKAKGVAEQAVKQFHDQLNRGDFKNMYAAAHAELKAAATEKDFVDLLNAIHRKLGLVQTSEQNNWNISSHNFSTYVVLAYKTKFADGDGIETFTYRVDGEKAVLVGYNINSQTLVTK